MNEAHRAELARCIEPLRQLLQLFVAERITGEEFDSAFFKIYQDLGCDPSPEVNEAMERFFGYADDHVADPSLRDDPADLSTDDLRAHAAALLNLAGLR